MNSPRTQTVTTALVGVTVLLLAAIALLILGVDSFEFRAAKPIEYASAPVGGNENTEARGWQAVTLIMRVLVTISLAVVIFQLIFSRRFRIYYLVLILLFGGILLATEFVGCNRTPPEDVEGRSTQQMMEDAPIAQAASEDVETEPSNGLYVLVAIILSTVAVAGAIFFAARWLRRRPKSGKTEVHEILESLSSAARRIRAGEDPYTVVLLCYQEMLRILSVVGRIDATCLTPREFQDRLRQFGLSGQHVARLTEMFEIVRYARRTDESFSERALACLDAIREAHADAAS